MRGGRETEIDHCAPTVIDTAFLQEDVAENIANPNV